MRNSVVYTVKVGRDDLAQSKRFFGRQGLDLQTAVRALIRTSANCESCLSLVEAKASIAQVQSSFANILVEAKELWRLNGLLERSVLEVARVCKLPEDFIQNVLSQAQSMDNPTESRAG